MMITPLIILILLQWPRWRALTCPTLSMIVLVWNCRGLGRSTAIRSLIELIHSHRPVVLFLSETKIKKIDVAIEAGEKLGYTSMHCVLAVGRSGGLLLLWKDPIKIDIIIDTSNMINCMVLNDGTSTHLPWQCTFVYGPPVPVLKPFFWADLNRVRESFNGAWMIVGDFNCVLEQLDKKGGKVVLSSSIGGFRGLVDSNGLIDLGFSGYAFTWNIKRVWKNNI